MQLRSLNRLLLLKSSSRNVPSSTRLLFMSTVASETKGQGHITAPPQSLDKWDLFAGVVLERKPVITQEMTPMEKEYSQLLAKYEFELSKKSSHEIRKEKDLQIIEKIKSGELESDQASALTAQDEEDAWSAELNQFKLSSRKTEADEKNDQRSLERALDSHLVLLIEQKLGKDYKWICPQGKWVEGETMRQTAERTMKEVCPEIKVKVLGNAPWGFYKYKYPKRVVSGQQLSSVGAKIFFFKAQVISGEILAPKSKQKENKSEAFNTEYKDYLWLTRNEMVSKLLPEYHRQITEFIVDENN